MNERVDLSRRMLSEAEIRLRDFGAALSNEKTPRTSELKRLARLLATSQRNMQWIAEAPSFFGLRQADINSAAKLNIDIANCMKKIHAKISEISSDKTTGRRKARNIEWAVRSEGNGVLSPVEIHRIDALIRALDEAPTIDHETLWRNAEGQRRLEIDRVFSGGLSFGEATNAPPILNQPEESFRAELKAIDNDLVEQIKIIEHCLPRWFSMGEFPPPYYALRIAVILRKSKESGREREFLRAYLTNFRSRFGGSRTDEKLVERAQKLGIELPPVR